MESSPRMEHPLQNRIVPSSRVMKMESSLSGKEREGLCTDHSSARPRLGVAPGAMRQLVSCDMEPTISSLLEKESSTVSKPRVLWSQATWG